MSGLLHFRGFWALLLAASLGWSIWKHDQLEGESAVPRKHGRYQPYLSGWLLPLFLFLALLLGLLFAGPGEMLVYAGMCASVFVHMAVYDLILLLFLPLLRRRFSARTCAVLWLLPNYLYLTQGSIFLPDRPLWVISAPEGALRWLVLIWAAGACAVLLWRVASHLRFRRRVLAGAEPVSDPAALEVWREELARVGGKAPIRGPVHSRAVRTPLSIGFTRATLRVVLPEREYAPEQLSLIFRHELIHIGRQDCWTKFFLTFCTAVCWFNPLMWLAMRRSADDMELSCDETVLGGAPEEERRRYADLLLRTAGDERGFTTCLSASARALRYRLRHVLAPGERSLGCAAAGIIFFALLVTGGYTALAADGVTGGEALFPAGTQAYTLEHINFEDLAAGHNQGEYACADPQALAEYLSGLELSRVLGFYSFSGPEEGRFLSAWCSGPEDSVLFTLRENVLEVIPLRSGGARHYLLDGEADWPLLASLLA